MNDSLLDSIRRQEDNRDECEFGSENWLFFNRDVEWMRKELQEREVDECYSVRSWPITASTTEREEAPGRYGIEGASACCSSCPHRVAQA